MSAPATRVLFVCTGNTCRSPLAAAIARAAATERGGTLAGLPDAPLHGLGLLPLTGLHGRADLRGELVADGATGVRLGDGGAPGGDERHEAVDRREGVGAGVATTDSPSSLRARTSRRSEAYSTTPTPACEKTQTWSPEAMGEA